MFLHSPVAGIKELKKLMLNREVRVSTKNIMVTSGSQQELDLIVRTFVNPNDVILVDEPEKSLSSKRQIELMKFIEDSARFLGCQFIISTHSPHLLAMRGAKIYDLDEK